MGEDWKVALIGIEEHLKTIAEILKSINKKLGPEAKKEIIVKEEIITTEKKAKYQWFKTSTGEKVRACNNPGCPYFLKWNGAKNTYEHGKYDPNTRIWTYIDDLCEYFQQED